MLNSEKVWGKRYTVEIRMETYNICILVKVDDHTIENSYGGGTIDVPKNEPLGSSVFNKTIP